MAEWADVYYLVSLTAFGLVFGSFANVVIWRFPRGESVIQPGSRCPACGRGILWYDNIPVLSWLMLRARCRACGARISVRYPIVEILSGGLWLTAGLLFGFSLQTVAAIVFFYLLMVLSFIDLDTMRLPNPLVLALAVLGILAAGAAQATGRDAAPLVGLADSGLLAQPLGAAAVGVALGMAPTLFIAGAYSLLRGRHGLGMGDVKLLGAMGPFLGPYVLFAFFGGSIVGTVVWLPIAVWRTARGEGGAGRMRMPFGPFIALGGFLAVVVGPEIVQWYGGLVGL